MSTFSLDALLGLYSIPSIGPTRMRKLISVFGTPQNVLQAATRQLIEVEGIDLKTAAKIKAGVDEGFVQRQRQFMDKLEIGVLTYWDEAYPQQLKSIYDPPVFLFYKGDLNCLSAPAIAVVGTRKPSSYGKMVSERLSEELARRGFTLISGFARGVDTIAHKTALKNGAATIAVLGNGIDYIYPAENRPLFKQMTEGTQGLILSEYPMGTMPDAGNFPKRNRIISGISVGVLVTEAGEKSGALLTAMYANDQNREVFAVPGAITSPLSAGTHHLIQSGAKLVHTAEDILEELGYASGSAVQEDKAPPDLHGELKTVYDALSQQPVHVDQVALQSGLSVSETLSALLTLELMGLIRQMAGKMFIRL